LIEKNHVLADWYQAEWLVLFAVWLIGAAGSKPTVRRESALLRIRHVGLLALAALLLFRPAIWGPLDVRFLPESWAVGIFGLVLSSLGSGFAIWARLILGRNWSGTVTVKADHQLICRGPYRLVRHPIYSGVLLAMLGNAIGYGRLPCLLSVPIAFLALWVKSRTEEQFMREQFGAQYQQYQQTVNAIIPGLL